MGADFIARGLAAQAKVQARSGAGVAPFAPLFAELAIETVPDSIDAFLSSGYSALGKGVGVYVADALATSGLASAHPRFCKADAAGRYFRLLPDDAGLIPVACGGGNGQANAITDASVNDQPAIQAAEDYKHAVGAAGLRFDAEHYAARRVPRPQNAGFNFTGAGFLFRARSSTVWKTTHPSGRSTIWRRASTGVAMADAGGLNVSYQILDSGNLWRGGGILTEGQASDPGDPSVGSLTLDGIMLDGGLATTGNHDWYTNDPDGWDLSDKGIWQQNDTYCGHITLKGRAGVRKFRGEVVYTSGVNPTWTRRILTIEDGVEIGDSNGSCLNPQGITLKVGRCLCYSAPIGIEGWTGAQGGYIRAHFRNCASSSLQGGQVNVDSPETPGGYYSPRRTPTGELPMGHIDLLLENSAMTLGSWIEGRIVQIDGNTTIGAPAAGLLDASEVKVEVIDWTDRESNVAALSIFGECTNVHVKLHMRRTKNAVAGNFKKQYAVYAYGSVGENVWIEPGDLDYLPHGQVYAGSITGYRFSFRNWPARFPSSPLYYDLATPSGAIGYDGFYTVLAGGSATSYPLILPTSNINPGSEWWLYNINSASAGVARVPLHSGLVGGEALHIPPGCMTKLVFDLAGWQVVVPPSNKPNGIAGPVAVQSGGTAIPAGGLSDWLDITVPGAVVGMSCQVDASPDLGDNAEIIARVAAANTVRFRVRNTGDSNLAIDNTYFRATAWGGF